jgi:hypothetical protein
MFLKNSENIKLAIIVWASILLNLNFVSNDLKLKQHDPYNVSNIMFTKVRKCGNGRPDEQKSIALLHHDPGTPVL